MKKSLPVGSIVILNSNRRIMICGKNGREKGGNKIYDYVGCDYPQGYLSEDMEIMFNSSSIQEIVSLGGKK